MGANQDLIQRAVVCAGAVVGTLLDGTLDGLVCITVHVFSSFENGFLGSMACNRKSMQGMISNCCNFNVAVL